MIEVNLSTPTPVISSPTILRDVPGKRPAAVVDVSRSAWARPFSTAVELFAYSAVRVMAA